MRFRAFSIVFLISALPIIALAEQVEKEAPFGLRWGMSASEMRQMGVNLTLDRDIESVATYDTLTLPRDISGIEQYYLQIPERYGLQKIVAIGEDIENDPFGTDGKQEYERIKSIISGRYGEPSDEANVVGLTLYDERDEFYQCLQYDGCGGWMAIWETKGVAVVLQLKGLRRGTGYIDIVIEGPKWSEFVHQTRDDIRRQDQEAF